VCRALVCWGFVVWVAFLSGYVVRVMGSVVGVCGAVWDGRGGVKWWVFGMFVWPRLIVVWLGISGDGGVSGDCVLGIGAGD